MIDRIKDVYTWGAIYDDRAPIFEKDSNCFADVDQECVKTLVLLSPAGGCIARVDIPQGAQPVFFRRRSIKINLLQGQGNPRPTVHCIGWKRGDEATYLFVFEDGSTLLTNNLQAV